MTTVEHNQLQHIFLGARFIGWYHLDKGEDTGQSTYIMALRHSEGEVGSTSLVSAKDRCSFHRIKGV